MLKTSKLSIVLAAMLRGRNSWNVLLTWVITTVVEAVHGIRRSDCGPFLAAQECVAFAAPWPVSMLVEFDGSRRTASRVTRIPGRFRNPRESSKSRFAWPTLLRPAEGLSHHLEWIMPGSVPSFWTVGVWLPTRPLRLKATPTDIRPLCASARRSPRAACLRNWQVL